MPDDQQKQQRNQHDRLRRRAKQQGLKLEKSPNPDHHEHGGGFRLVRKGGAPDSRDEVVYGETSSPYDASLDEIERYLNR